MNKLRRGSIFSADNTRSHLHNHRHACDERSFEALQKSFYSAIYSTGINWLSLPAGVVPVGMIEGRPAGVQIIGRRFREDLILDAMQKIEDRVGVLTEQLWKKPEMI